MAARPTLSPFASYNAQSSAYPQDLAPFNWHMAELIEAAARAGTPELPSTPTVVSWQ
jgi:hypothetical protein